MSIIHRSYSTRQPKITSKFEETSFKLIKEKKTDIVTSKNKSLFTHYVTSKTRVIVASTASKKLLSGTKLFILNNRFLSSRRSVKTFTHISNYILTNTNTPKEYSQKLFKFPPDSTFLP